MKTRTGFVSNSSSSSFILDTRNPEHAEFLGFIKKYMDTNEVRVSEGADAIDYVEDIEVGYVTRNGVIPTEHLAAIHMDQALGWMFRAPKGVVVE